MILYLLRHGQTAPDGVFTEDGQPDPSLTPLGEAQARAAAEALAGVELSAIFSSDLRRAVATAGAVAARCSLEPRTDRRLREIDMGEAGRLGGAEFARLHPEAARELEASRRQGEASLDFRYPGGETGAEAAARAENFLADLVRGRGTIGAGERVLLVCHGGLIRALVARLLGMEERRRFRLMPGNCGLTRIELSTGEDGARAAEGGPLAGARLLSFNEEGHLGGRTSF